MKPVFIVTTGENGAGLVTGLLDSHPQLAVLPFIFDFYLRYDKAKSVAELPGLIVDYPMIARIFDGGSSIAYGDFRGFKFSRSAFVADFLARIGAEMPNRAAFFEAAFLSLCKSFGIATEGKTPVAHIHFTDYAAAYMEDFPEARWIVCDASRQNMLAYSSFTIPSVLPKEIIPYCVQWQARIDILDTRKNEVSKLPSPFHVMFEELLTSPRNVANSLADWMHIERAESLYNSTALNRPLSCTYPTGTISIVKGDLTGKNLNRAALLGGRRGILWPIRFKHYRTERAIDARYTLRDLARSLRASAGQTTAEILYYLSIVTLSNRGAKMPSETSD